MTTAEDVFTAIDAQKARAARIWAEVDPMLTRLDEYIRSSRNALNNGYPSTSKAFLMTARDYLDAALKQFPKE